MTRPTRHHTSRRPDRARRPLFDEARRRILRFEPLETRAMLSASGSDLPAPQISLPTVPGTLNGGGTISGIWVSDPGSSDITLTMTVEHGTIKVGNQGGEFFGNSPVNGDGTFGGLTISGDGTTTVTLTGTAPEIYDALNPYNGPAYVTADNTDSFGTDPFTYYGTGLVYTPDQGFAGADRLTVSASGTNGTTTSATSTSALLLDVAPYAVAPTINVPDSGQAGSPTSATAPGAVFSNAGGDPITVTDPAVGSKPIQVWIAAPLGTLALGSTAGVTISGEGNGTNWMSLTGTVAAINHALDGLAYTPGSNYTGRDTLYLYASDLGNTSYGIPQTSYFSQLIESSELVAPTQPQQTSAGSPLVFNTQNGNAILVNHFGLANDQLRLSLSVPGNDTLTLAQTTGLTFVSGGNGQGSMTVQGTAAALTAALDGLKFTPSAGFTGQTSLSINAAWQSAIGGSFDPELTSTVNIYVNQTPPSTILPPAFSLPPNQNTGLTAPLAFSTAGGNAIAVVDPGATGSADQLTLSVTAGNLALARTAGVTITAGANDSSSFTIEGTLAAINAAINGLVYTPNGTAIPEDTLSLSYFGLGSVYPNTTKAEVGIFMAAANPVSPITAPTNLQTTTSSVPLVFSSSGGNAISLAGAGNQTVQVSLSVGGTGTLALGRTSNISFVAGANDSSQMTIQGTVAALNAALDNLTYTPGSGDVGQTELDVSSSLPGNLIGTVSQASIRIQDNPSVVAVPISVPATQNVLPSTPVVFSSANENAITVGGSSTQQVQVALSAADGTLSLASILGLTIVAGRDGTGSLTIAGSVAAINRALDGLTYTPSAGSSSADAIDIALTKDSQISAATVAISPQLPFNPTPTATIYTVTQEISLNGSPVDLAPSSQFTNYNPAPAPTTPPATLPAPIITLPSTAARIDGSPTAISGLSISGADLVEVTLSVKDGTLQASGPSGLSIQGNGTASLQLAGTAAQVNALQLTYTADPGYGGSDGLTVAATAVAELAPPPIIADPPVSQGPGPVTTNSATGVSTYIPSPPAVNTWTTVQSQTNTTTLALVVSPPTLVAPLQQTDQAPFPLVFSSANGNAISITDPAVGSNIVQLTLRVAAGTLNLSGTSGLTFSGGTANGDATIVVTGTVSAINSALAGLSYTADNTTGGSDTLNISYSELKAGSGRSVSASVPITILPAYSPATVSIELPNSPYIVNLNLSLGVAINGLWIGENGDAPLQVTISVQHGTLTSLGYAGVTITGQNTSTLVLSGSDSAIQAIFDGNNGLGGNLFAFSSTPDVIALPGPEVGGITYYPSAFYSGADTLSVSVATPLVQGSGVIGTGSMTLSDNAAGYEVIASHASNTYAVGGAPVAIDPGIQIETSAPDLNLQSATISVTGSNTSTVTLDFTSQNGITGTISGNELYLQGIATAAQYQAALRSITFSSTGTTPETYQIEFSPSGFGAGYSATEQMNVVAPQTANHSTNTTTSGASHGNHSVGSLGEASGSQGGHNIGGSSGTPTGPTPGGFNYVPPPPPVFLATGGSSGGSSAGGTSTPGGDKKTFAPVDQVFSQLGPDDFLL